MKLVTTPDYNADNLKDGQLITLKVQHFGVVKDVEFRVWMRAEGDEADEAVLTSTSAVAYCRVSGGKSWPCDLRLCVMTSKGRSRDIVYPARTRIPTWNLSGQTSRLNRQYPICGWWGAYCEATRSQHNSA